jgi:hypothetical protein
MKSYKDPSFQDRAASAAEAKRKALDNLRSKAPIDPEVAAQRQAARLKREAGEAEKRAAKKQAGEAAKAAEAARKAEAEASAAKPIPTEAERKAARDARYAARKSRK